MVTFEYVTMEFSQKEWILLEPSQRTLYKEMMLKNCRILALIGKTDAIFVFF
jgi:KRAB domain-containing zinc finger protein